MVLVSVSDSGRWALGVPVNADVKASESYPSPV